MNLTLSNYIFLCFIILNFQKLDRISVWTRIQQNLTNLTDPNGSRSASIPLNNKQIKTIRKKLRISVQNNLLCYRQNCNFTGKSYQTVHLKIVNPSGLGEVILGAQDQDCHLFLLSVLVDILLYCLNTIVRALAKCEIVYFSSGSHSGLRTFNRSMRYSTKY